MNKESLVEITQKLYKLTLLFPKKEPLRYKMRETADEILKYSVLIFGNIFKNSQDVYLEVEKNLEILDSFFEVAKFQNWVSPSMILELEGDYRKLKELLKSLPSEISFSDQELPLNEQEQQKDYFLNNNKEKPKNNVNTFLNERQEKIVEVLKERGKVQAWEIKQFFPNITKRTIRRDFEQMLNKGFIVRIGEKNNTFYQLKFD